MGDHHIVCCFWWSIYAKRYVHPPIIQRRSQGMADFPWDYLHHGGGDGFFGLVINDCGWSQMISEWVKSLQKTLNTKDAFVVGAVVSAIIEVAISRIFHIRMATATVIVIFILMLLWSINPDKPLE